MWRNKFTQQFVPTFCQCDENQFDQNEDVTMSDSCWRAAAYH